jgi:hypothetical protein
MSGPRFRNLDDMQRQLDSDDWYDWDGPSYTEANLFDDLAGDEYRAKRRRADRIERRRPRKR